MSNDSFKDAVQSLSELTLTARDENGVEQTTQVHVLGVDDAQLDEVDQIEEQVEQVVDEIVRNGDTNSPARTHSPDRDQVEEPVEQQPVDEIVRNSGTHSPVRTHTPDRASRDPSQIERPASPGLTHAEVLQQHREVNDIAHLKRALPDDLRGGVHYILRPLRSHFANDTVFNAFVDNQRDILQEEGITGKAELLQLARTVMCRDNLMRLGNGTVGGAHFNLPDLPFTYGPLSLELTTATPAGTRALQGALGGLVAGASDAISTPAKEATFKDAYYKRPAAEHLPENLRNLNAQGLGDAIKETNISWVGAFGASYATRMAVSAATTYTVGVDAAANIEAAIAPVTNIAAGIGATFIQHKLDERQGRTGLPLFFARQNLRECVRASKQSTLAYAGEAAMGTVNHVKNVVTKFPEGVVRATTDAGLIASSVSLTAGLSVPFTVSGAVAQAFADKPKVGHMVSSITKYVALEGAWAGWSTAYAAGAHWQANRGA
ncbi:hypothetical protein [Paraburkholderia sp.]|uniref:hypothetical protein n=1 Tax=Paraburkholderia sp. TaxID=1926495 RepID=UPI003D6E1626